MTSSAPTHGGRPGDDVAIALPDDMSAPGLARKVVRATLSRWHLQELSDDAALAVSELVTNAFKHALPPVVLSVTRRPGKVRIAVSDMRPATASLVLPVQSKDSDESGRGRGIIAAVSDESGTDHAADGGEGASSYASWDIDPLPPGSG